MSWRDSKKVIVLVLVVAVCLFEYVLHRQSNGFRELEESLLPAQWMLLACFFFWGGIFLFLTSSLNDFLVIGLILTAVVLYFIGRAAFWRESDARILFGTVTIWK